MSLVLTTNLNSLVAQNSLTASGGQLATALQQLSSGLRINTAADDAAGYAIVQGMTSQINGINQAARNANDGVSLSQTASGSLQEVVNDLQTMRDLAVQSLNATNGAGDRADLNAQFQQLKADINSVATQTQFNGVNLLDGSFQGATFQVGANAGQTITVASVASAKANNLGTAYTQAGAAVTGATFTTAVKSGDSGTFTVNGFTTSAVALTGNQATDLKSVAAAINQIAGSDGNVIATVNSNGGIDLTSTTSQIVNSSYTAGTGSTGTATLATFGIGAQNALAAAGTSLTNTIYKSAGTVAAGAVVANDTGTITINGIATAAITLTGTTGAANLAQIVTAINLTTATNGGVSAAVDTAGTGIDLTSATSQTATVAYTAGVGAETAATFGLATGAITTATPTTLTATSTSSTVDSASVTTVDNSNKVLVQIDAALQQLATTGAQLGAYQNRFQAAVTGLNTTATNLTSARSQIQDTDYASATSALSKAQILQQAGTAMVAQANTIPQNILTLLQKLP